MLNNLEFIQLDDKSINQVFLIYKETLELYEQDKASMEGNLEWFYDNLLENIENYFAIYLSGEQVGFYAIRHTDSLSREMDFLYIYPQYRRKKIGTDLIKDLIDNSYKSISINVYKNNEPLYQFLKAFDFEVVNVVRGDLVYMTNFNVKV